MKNRPKNFVPPYPAWELNLPPTSRYVQCQVALQFVGGHRDDSLFQLLTESLSNTRDLMHYERAGHIDAWGAYNDIAIAYWSCEESMMTWLREGFTDLQGVVRGKSGSWYEALTAPRTHFEVSASTPEADWGIFRHFDTCDQHDHAYWGAMRDRISAAENSGLPGQLQSLQLLPAAERSDKEIFLPGNLCMIRTVQGYSAASPEERNAYQKSLRQKYEQGINYLNKHPVQSRCLSARLLSDEQPAPGRPDTETIAWFASLKDLENWVHHHSTHKAIYASAQQYANRFSPGMQLLLSHEVAVVPPGKGRAAYTDCHPDTGLRRFLR
ncbi:phenylacetaldoxime dehydratase family protein [Microbulbifer sp. MLAF003]|uniref:phenylacetaldoxime dehydratase family protein n=1 Tax=Microbulbifer TaxID=48073 RepID=UPI00037171B0|nr:MULTISPECIES: phenylacetaldoxime dehydratase family protein [Microbulbifer]WHI51460.1 phenylacetaldoxime dehydratase family protein [Microbulbifer sp. MLAF003]